MADGCGACEDFYNQPRRIFFTDHVVALLNDRWSPFLGRAYLIPRTHSAALSARETLEKFDLLEQIDVLTEAIRLAFKPNSISHFVKTVEEHLDYDVKPAYREAPLLEGRPFQLFGGDPWSDPDAGTDVLIRSQKTRPAMPVDLVGKIIKEIQIQLPEARRLLHREQARTLGV